VEKLKKMNFSSHWIAISTLLLSVLRSLSYPLISEIDIEKCYTFNIPEDDDAHMIFVAMPDDYTNEEEDDELESYWVNTLYDMSKDGGEDYPEMAPKITDEKILSKIGDTKERNTRLQVKIQKPHHGPLRTVFLKYHTPVLFTDVLDMAEEEGHGEDVALEGWSICFLNKGDELIKIIFDVVLVSDETEKEKANNHKEQQAQRKTIKKENLTPLETNFNAALVGADKILNEMNYMERREQRMRVTADSTNKRVRYFSYLSVFVLLGTACVQIMYLKNYFKKKKLM